MDIAPDREYPLKEDMLRHALERLRVELTSEATGTEWDWPEAVALALTRVEQELRRHLTEVRTGEELASELDQTRPTLVRQKETLCRHFRNLIELVQLLKWDSRLAARAMDYSSWDDGPKLRRQGWTACLQRVRKFLAKVNKTLEDENALILEGVNTEIGVGD